MEGLTVERHISAWLQSMRIKNARIKLGEVHVDGDVYLKGCLGSADVLPVKFGEVTGVFDCGSNFLKNTKGFPTKAESLDCSFNEISDINSLLQVDTKTIRCRGNPFTTGVAPELVGKIADMPGDDLLVLSQQYAALRKAEVGLLAGWELPTPVSLDVDLI